MVQTTFSVILAVRFFQCLAHCSLSKMVTLVSNNISDVCAFSVIPHPAVSHVLSSLGSSNVVGNGKGLTAFVRIALFLN